MGAGPETLQFQSDLARRAAIINSPDVCPAAYTAPTMDGHRSTRLRGGHCRSKGAHAGADKGDYRGEQIAALCVAKLQAFLPVRVALMLTSRCSCRFYFARMAMAIVTSAIASSRTLWPQRAINPTMINLLSTIERNDLIWCVIVYLPHLLWARNSIFPVRLFPEQVNKMRENSSASA